MVLLHMYHLQCFNSTLVKSVRIETSDGTSAPNGKRMRAERSVRTKTIDVWRSEDDDEVRNAGVRMSSEDACILLKKGHKTPQVLLRVPRAPGPLVQTESARNDVRNGKEVAQSNEDQQVVYHVLVDGWSHD